jgi:hypothetical protein
MYIPTISRRMRPSPAVAHCVLRIPKLLCAAPAAILILSTACAPEAVDLTLSAALEDFRVDADDEPGGGAVRRPGGNNLVDGSSNTIQVDEADSPDDASQDGTGAGAPDSSSAVDSTDAARVADDDSGVAPAPDAAQQAETIRALTREFGNKFFEFGRSAGNSDNDAFVTGTNQLTLCTTGRFQLREQFSFSSDINFLPDPDDSIGTWSIIARADGSFAVELQIEQTTATSQAPVLQLELAADDAGNLFMNGARVFTIEDATRACQ